MTRWTDDYWLPLMQLYLRSPRGPKPIYARAAVALAMELHVDPEELHMRLMLIHTKATPTLRRLWQRYAGSARRLSRDIKRQQSMDGFGNASAFYAGVELRETFEPTFRPVAPGEVFTPMMLTMVLDLYYRLTPLTMVADTPEVRQLARVMRVEPGRVAEALAQFMLCDPAMRRPKATPTALLPHCQDVWRQHGNDDLFQLALLAEQYQAYFDR